MHWGCHMATRILLLRGLLLATVLATLLISGCDREQDVTNEPSFGGFAAIVGMYRTKVPTKIVECNKTLMLVVADAPAFECRLIAELPAGIAVRVERLRYRQTVSRSFVWVDGSLVDGAYARQTLRLDDDFFPPNILEYYEFSHDNPAATRRAWSVMADKLEKQ